MYTHVLHTIYVSDTYILYYVCVYIYSAHFVGCVAPSLSVET